jgi:hypothetical protein
MERTTQNIAVGLFTDTDFINQPENTYRFALNAVNETHEGEIGSLSTEAGNTLCLELEEGFEVIGSRFIGNDKYVLFITDDETSIIGIQTGCSFEEKVRTTCLGFKKKWPISVLSRVIRGCDNIIYFTDKNNSYRSINLDRIEDYFVDGEFSCDLANHFPPITYPNINLVSVNDGGGRLQVGVYQFAVQYLDAAYNEIEWSYVTNPVAIYDENISSEFDVIDGAWNSETGIRPNGVRATNKSIRLQIESVDQRYAFIRIAGIESTEGLATVTNVYYTPEIPITNTSVEYIYTGDVSNYTIGSLLDIQTPRPYIETVAYHAQIDNRLVLANTTSPNYNFCGFQRFANNITSKYTVKRIPAYNQFEEGNPKNPASWYQTRGFAADEVYAFGIVYVFKSGYHSPAFHIPGRASDILDMQLDTVGTTVDLADVKHVDSNIQEGDTVRRWRWQNTARLDGTMAFWRATAEYPLDTDCDGEYLYGDLAGESIRHHRFPDRRLIRHFSQGLDGNGELGILGIQFDGVEYPHEDIVGHYFVYVKRDDFNRTVLDSGVMTYINNYGEFRLNVNEGIFGGQLNIDTGTPYEESIMKFISPKTLIRKEYLNGDYFKFNHKYNTNGGGFLIFEYGAGFLNAPDATINVFRSIWDELDVTGASTYNRAYSTNIYLTPNSSAQQINNFPFDGEVQNRSCFNWANLYALDNNLASSDYANSGSFRNAFYVTNKIEREVNVDLYALVYSRLHNSILSGAISPEIYGGDTFISRIDYIDLHQTGGDNEENEEVARGTYDSGFWVESELNMFMRHATDGVCNSYFKGGDIGQYILNKLTDLVDGKYVYKDVPCPENYFYNEDYSKLNVENFYPAISRRYECCARCLETNPNRVWYSTSTDPSSFDDGYRIILANDFRNIYGEDVAITDMFVHMDNLYVRTERSLYLFPTKDQVLQSNEAAIFIGSGEFLSLKPRKLATSDNGYGGGKDEFARVSTEYGTMFVDRNQNKVFFLSGLNDLKEISALGMNNWFQENLGLEFAAQWQSLHNEEYPYQYPTGRYGIGYIAVYDPRHKRYILHKRDYKYIGPGELKWRGDVLVSDTGRTFQSVDFDDAEYFENKSFTISFKLTTNTWTSFHSYLPKFAYSGAINYFTTRDNTVWKHGNKNYLSYYGNKKPHVVDFIVNKNPVHTWVTDSISYLSNAKEVSGDQYNNVNDVTFNGLVVYNDNQISGYHNLGVQDLSAIYESINTPLLAGRKESTWRINSFFDQRVNYNVPMFSKDWDVLSNDYFTDKVVNPDSVSNNKNIYEMARMRDKYCGIRLYYNPNERDIKLVTNILETLKRYSVR